MSSEELERRSRVLIGLVALAFFVLAGRLGHLQLVQGAKWEDVARGQSLRQVAIPAPRGNIYDRNGVLLAGNNPAYTVSLVYTGKRLPDSAVRRLSEILSIPEADIRKASEQLQPASGRPYQPVPLKTKITEEEHTRLEEYRDELPGVVIDVQPLRVYPGLPADPAAAPADAEFDPGTRLAAHVLGTVKQGDRGPSPVGSDGLEAHYNGNPEGDGSQAPGLQGRDGIQLVEVDAQGRPTRVVGGEPPVPGNNLVLTIDARIQAAAERALLKRMTELRKMRNKDCPNGCAAEYGAAVAIDVRTGEILALASVPAFDPNSFADRIYAVPGTEEFRRWQQTWQALNNDPGKPLLNHATMDAAPPGSTFKPVTALAALQTKVTTPAERVACPGYVLVGNHRFGDWHTHGAVNLEQALGRSCDVYFYRMAQRMKIQSIVDMARQFGLGRKTGLEERDGIRELAGWLAGPETKKIRHPKEPTWYSSQNLSVAIGQDDNQFTPLQMASMTATIAAGGLRYRPYLVKAITDPAGNALRRFEPELLGRVQADPKHFEAVQKGMLSVTRLNSGWSGTDTPAGTAYSTFAEFYKKAKERLGREVLVAGKTGSAETGRKGETPFGWFVAYAPFDKPEIAIAVFVRHGGGGNLAGAPVARAILEEYFGLNKPLPAAPAPSEGRGKAVPAPKPHPEAAPKPQAASSPSPGSPPPSEGPFLPTSD